MTYFITMNAALQFLYVCTLSTLSLQFFSLPPFATVIKVIYLIFISTAINECSGRWASLEVFLKSKQNRTTAGVQRHKPPLTSSPKAPMPFELRSITWLMQSPPTVEKLAWSHGKGIGYSIEHSCVLGSYSTFLGSFPSL